MIAPEHYPRTDGKKALILSEMTWPELSEALSGLEFALIPTGSTEQHGPGGTFAVDTARAEGLSRLVAARLYPQAVSVPPIPYGVSHHHMKFPGTVTVEASIFSALCEQVMGSLYAHGLRKFVLINGHGGNVPALGVAANRFRFSYPDSRVVSIAITKLVVDVRDEGADSLLMGHACEGEMSQCMYLAPWTVRVDALAPGEIRPGVMPATPAITEARPFDELTINGALGDATRSSEEFGRAMIEAAVERLAEYLKEW